MERGVDIDEESENYEGSGQTIWHAGDWTGPLSLQPDAKRSAISAPGETPKDIIAVPQEGVKVSGGCLCLDFVRLLSLSHRGSL